MSVGNDEVNVGENVGNDTNFWKSRAIENLK